MTPEKEAEQIEIVRRMQIPNIFERTALHAEFNARLSIMATAQGFAFIDDFSLFVDPVEGRLSDNFIKKSKGTDVHIDRTFESVSLVERLIRRTIEESAALCESSV